MGTSLKVSMRSSNDEKEYFKYVAQKLGYLHLSEFFRVAAHEKIKREMHKIPKRIKGIVGAGSDEHL
jgi:hypothetical protein